MQNRNRPETLYSKSMMKKPTSSFFSILRFMVCVHSFYGLFQLVSVVETNFQPPKSVFNILIFEMVICRGKLAKGFWFYKYAFNSVSIKIWLPSFFCSTLTNSAAGWFLLWSQESRDVTVPKTCPLLNSQKHTEVQTHLNNHSYGCRDTPNLLLRKLIVLP